MLAAWLASAALVLIPHTAQAQDLSSIAYTWVHDEISRTTANHTPALRMEVELGRLDPRLQLAPCHQVQAYLPAGSRLWGRTRVGLRCVQGAKAWNVFMPVTVRAWGPAWVMTRNASMGDVLDIQHASAAEVDWAAETAPIIASENDWLGQTAARHLVPGQALRQNMVRPAQLFKSGAVVRVLSQGPGFVITSSGKALSGGEPGQEVRVRMEGGRIVTGTVNAQGEVLISQ